MLVLTSALSCCATNQPLRVSDIRELASKGRIQDAENQKDPAIPKILAMGRDAVPWLIDQLEDETSMQGVVGFCPWLHAGDIALFFLADLFREANWERSTIPEVALDQFLEGSPDAMACSRLNSFVEKHGRKFIKDKWRRVWLENRDRLEWDPKDSCFRVKPETQPDAKNAP
jgi:hypothetical protein